MTQEVTAKQKSSIATVAELAAAREARGMTQVDVSQRIKLQVRQVAALEEARWDALPGKSFVRGALRGYGKLLDVDVAPLLEAIGGFAEPAEMHGGSRRDDAALSRSSGLGFDGGGRGSAILWVIAGLVGVVVLVLYFGSDQDASRLRSWLPGGLPGAGAPAQPAGGSAGSPAAPAVPAPSSPPSPPSSTSSPSSTSPSSSPSTTQSPSSPTSSWSIQPAPAVGTAPAAAAGAGASPGEASPGGRSSPAPLAGSVAVGSTATAGTAATSATSATPPAAPGAPGAESPSVPRTAPASSSPLPATGNGQASPATAAVASAASGAAPPATAGNGAARREAGDSGTATANAISPAPIAPSAAASASTAAPATKAAPATPTPSATAPRGLLQFRAGEDSWIEVRQADGKALHSAMLKAGDTLELKGQPPYRVVMGNPGRLEFTYEGATLDLAPHTSKANIARMTLK